VGWNPQIPLRRNAPGCRVGATDAERATDAGCCPLSLAWKVRPGAIPETGDWAPRKDPFLLGVFLQAVERVAQSTARGVDLWQAVEQHKRIFGGQHDGARQFLEHALDQYFEYHEAREEQLGQLHLVTIWPKIEKDREKGKATLTVWATALYETSGGDREIRRLRMSSVRTEVTAWAYVAGHVAAEHQGSYPTRRVWVTEISLRDGIEHHLLDGVTREAAEELYLAHGRPAAKNAARGEVAKPGRDCSSCKLTAACTERIPVPGFLQAEQPGPWTRSVSASDLEMYERCPSQWYMDREAHLPRDDEGNEALLRGRAVHRWIEAAHARGRACALDDLPHQLDDIPVIGSEVLEPGDYQLADSYLRAHMTCCPLRDGPLQSLAAERTLYAYDSVADVVIATKPDATWLRDDTLVLHEIKSTQELPDLTADEILTRFLAVSWDLVALESGLISHFGASCGEVQLEVLSPARARIFTYRTDDKLLMKMARGQVRRLATKWLTDETWTASPNIGCGSCAVRRWCSSRDAWKTRVELTTSAAGAPGA